jgi:hypothetical protein
VAAPRGILKSFDNFVELPIDLAELKGGIFRRDCQTHARVRRLLWRVVEGKVVLHARAPTLMDDVVTFGFGRHVGLRVELIQAAILH